ncbi:MAG: Ig-like domain-containing protein, partial [Gemmatimonadota bacterium]|nr:Ig-like domain-containing protein [Gemmatimonadota bacterium]
MSQIKHCPDCEKPVEASAPACVHCGADLSWSPRGGEAWLALQDRLSKASADKYEVKRLIGYGGMAGVYLARDTQLNRYVALKLISPGLVLDPRMVRRFFQEAQTMAQLSHRHIVPIYDIRERDDLVYMVMRYVPGRTLAEVVSDAGEPLDPDLVATWMAQIAAALAHAHTRPVAVIHRDIKPSNILLDENGDALLTDFGIAKIQGDSNLTRTGHLIGTPAYMSPEQCQGRDLTSASDQYSLGTVAYELLAGVPPFQGPTLMILQAHSSSEAPRLLDSRPECPKPLADVVERMLAKAPEDRWPDMASLSREFAQVIRAPVSPGTLITWSKRVHQVTIPASADRVTLGTEERLEARILDQDGHEIGGRRIQWSSTNEQVAKVSPDGVVVGAGLGSAVIVARSGHAVTTLEIQVLPPTVSHIVVSPPSVEMQTGEARTLSVTCYARSGESVSAAPTFRVDRRDVVTVGLDGTLEALAPGEATVTVSAGGLDQTVAVRVEAATVATITPSVPRLDLTPGQRATIPVEVVGQDGRVQKNSVLWWSSSDPSVALVSGNGEIEAVAPGEALLTASAGATSATVHLVVRPAAGVTVGAAAGAVHPPAPPHPGATEIFAGGVPQPHGYGAPGPPVADRAPDAAHAASSGPAAGPPPPHAGQAGVEAPPHDPEARRFGPMAQRGVLAAIALLLVLVLGRWALSGGGESDPAVTLGPADTTLVAGQAFQVRLAGAGALAGESVQWASSDNSVATVSSTGMAQARTPGTAQISVRVPGITSSSSIVVNVVPAETAGRAVILGPAEVALGDRPAAYRIQTNDGSTPDAGDVTWSVDRGDLATVSPSGELTGRGPGTVEITATLRGEAVTQRVEIVPQPEQRVAFRNIEIARVPSRVTAGTTIQPVATLIDQGGQRHDAGNVSWSSSNSGVLRQTGPASFRGASPGEATLEVYSPSAGLRRSVSVIVAAAPAPPPDNRPQPEPDPPPPDLSPARVVISPRDQEVGRGDSRSLSAATLTAAGSPVSGTPLSWSSTNPAVATVTAQGVLTGVGAGSTHVVVQSGALRDSILVRVTAS